jgi:hypothetical protein
VPQLKLSNVWWLGQTASAWSESLNSVLNAYQDIGDEMPLLADYQELFSSNAHMREVLVMIYSDILEFHREAMLHFNKRGKVQSRVVGIS